MPAHPVMGAMHKAMLKKTLVQLELCLNKKAGNI